MVLEITVTNNAPSMPVYVNWQAITTNGVTVDIQTQSVPTSSAGCVSGQTQPAPPGYTIGSGGSYTFVCTFTAYQGAAGGAVSFLGWAVGTYSSGVVTSAEVLSNSLSVGYPLGSISGPFIPIPPFEYASSTNTLYASNDATVINSGSNHEVIFQAQIENTANAQVTVLQSSFLLEARVSQEQDYFIVGAASTPVTTWSSTWTTSGNQYVCNASPPTNPPSGASCTSGTIAVGNKLSLLFAATSPSGNSWTWGSSSDPQSPPEAVTMYVVIVYSYQNPSTGVYNVLAQAIPFAGVYYPT